MIRQNTSAQTGASSGQAGDEVERLIWNYLDGSISDGKARVLNGMLERSKSARRAYVEAVELHFGLSDMFRAN